MELALECPFCQVSIAAIDSEDIKTAKTFMGKHLAFVHREETQEVLYQLHQTTYNYKPQQQGKTHGFKRGL